MLNALYLCIEFSIYYMEEIRSILKSIKQKAEKSAKDFQVLKAENLSLKSEIEKLKNLNKSKDVEIDGVKHSFEILKIAKSVDGDESNKGSKQKITELVREIDNCIMLLK